MPSPSVSCPGPATNTQDEWQRLLQQENGVFAGYSATGGNWGASSERNFASGTTSGGDFTSSGNDAASSSQGGARYDPLPAQYTAGPQRSRKLPIVSQGGWCIFAFMLGSFIAWIAQDMRAMSALNPSAIARRQLGWDRDYTKHLTQVSAMQNITADWAHQIEQHAAALEAMRQERAKWDKERVHQIEQHAAALEAMRQERAEWDKERAQWQAERRKHERLQEEQMELDLERQRRELEKEKDDERKKKAGLGWQDPQPDEHCLRFGTRRYTAKLENLPEGYNRMKACQETQAWINGRWVNPTQCDDGGLWGGIIGTWIVDWDEGGCHSFFQDFKDKGCSAQGSRKRWIESQLQNLQRGDDGMKMCSSTPADFHGLHFEGPHSCVNRGRSGYWGLWFIEDGSCA